MLQDYFFKGFGEQLMSVTRAAALPAVLCISSYATCAPAEKCPPHERFVSRFRGGRSSGCGPAREPRAAARASGRSAGQPEELGKGSCRASVLARKYRLIFALRR